MEVPNCVIIYTTYVVHIHMYNEEGEGNNLRGPPKRHKTSSQTNAGSLEPAVLLRLNLRVYSMPLEESQKSYPSKGRQKKNLLNVMEIIITRW